MVADTTAILQQLGIDVHAYAERIARASFEKGLVCLDISENRQMIGQYPPESEADVSLAATETERHTVRWMHEVYNRKMLGTIAKICAATVQFHGPLMSEL